MATTLVRRSSSAPERSASSIAARPLAEVTPELLSAFDVEAEAGLLEDLPSERGSLVDEPDRRPPRAASAAAARPAGPPPTTRTSYERVVTVTG